VFSFVQGALKSFKEAEKHKFFRSARTHVLLTTSTSDCIFTRTTYNYENKLASIKRQLA
jgi:hypothetical protein